MTETMQLIETSVAGVPARAWRHGTSATATVFLHGGSPGLTPYCSGAHIWGDVFSRFTADGDVVVLDLPGAGGTEIPTGPFTLGVMSVHVRSMLDALRISRAHLIGHDLGGLIALDVAINSPERVAAVTTVACHAAAPSGDLVENLTLAHPPAPRWSRHSQAWALERIAYSHHPIDTALLDACVAAAVGAAHREAVDRMAAGADAFAASLAQAKTRFFEACRGTGLAMPVQIVVGNSDPLGTMDQAMWLFRLIAAKQRATHLHVINRAGALPFRDEPAAFHAIVAAFGDTIARAALT